MSFILQHDKESHGLFYVKLAHGRDRSRPGDVRRVDDGDSAVVDVGGLSTERRGDRIRLDPLTVSDASLRILSWQVSSIWNLERVNRLEIENSEIERRRDAR